MLNKTLKRLKPYHNEKKRYVIPVIAIIISLCSCHKDKDSNTVDNKPKSGYKIEIIKGNNQTDTIGNLLKDSVAVRVTKDGKPLKNVYIRYETLGCDINSALEIPIYYTETNAYYKWRLNGTVGKQALKVILLDSVKSKKDSIEINATAIMPTHGWYRSSCSPVYGPIPNDFCRLSSGRLLAAFNSFDYPYYSDDNAITWHPIKTFPSPSSGITIEKLIASASDEVFAATQNNGLYYSKDGGQTWVAKNIGITDPRYFVDMNYTKSGRLIYTTYFGGVYISNDKGSSWQSVMTGLSNYDRFYYPSEQLNGDLVIINDGGAMYKSTNGGIQWTPVRLDFTYDVQSLFIDDNGDMYIGAANNSAELYRSNNNGVSWSKLYTAPPLPGVYREIQKMSKQNGVYYFYTYGNGLISTSNFNTFNNITPTYTEQSRCYIVSKNSNLIVGTQFNGIYYNLP